MKKMIEPHDLIKLKIETKIMHVTSRIQSLIYIWNGIYQNWSTNVSERLSIVCLD